MPHARIFAHVQGSPIRRASFQGIIGRDTLAYNRSFGGAGVAVLAGCTLAIACVTFGDAVTKEEVAHCRAVEKLSERLDCFKALKRSSKAQTKTEHAPSAAAVVATKSKTGDATYNHWVGRSS
jgi:hypothetical protein